MTAERRAVQSAFATGLYAELSPEFGGGAAYQP